ncbi:hypothetical protein EsDP_00001802 [Epichloe bromicola]|uniref:NEDD8-activating enzyme E1 regulatory subunit n=1 Tax=Epichloe bromicola TaxID=79588 RepID=A0ABQ0CIY4_9HYPO
MAPEPTPSLRGPSDNEQRYDRQLRLWAAAGQSALESANVLLVNTGGGSMGIETLKNLVLPGVGSFTIADEAVVRDADLGVNFFLDETCVGKPRALCCRDNLVELNPGVTGDWFPKENNALDFEKLFSSSRPFTMILYTLPLDSKHVAFLESYSNQHNIPILTASTSGFYAYFSLRLHSWFPVVDTHPDEAAIADLRLLNPWPELSTFASQMVDNIQHLDDHDHGHLPLVVILLHYLEKWKLTHGGDVPKAYSEKTAFRALVAQGARTNNSEGGEDNFDEAISAVMKYITQPSLPESLRQIFEHEENLKDPAVEVFWIIAKAVQQFHQKHHQLPLHGGLPDMKAQTSVYIELQSIYKSKSKRDVDEVMGFIRTLPGGHQIERDEVELFCKNARFIKLLQGSHNEPSIRQVIEKELASDEIAAIASPQLPLSLLPIFLVLRTSALAPRAGTEEIVERIIDFAPELRGNQRLLQVAQEVSRSGSGELHNVAAVVGGMIAQEMIKIITRQYVPIDNVCIFDGTESRCQILRLNLSPDCLKEAS